jgi:hypothetical protein
MLFAPNPLKGALILLKEVKLLQKQRINPPLGGQGGKITLRALPLMDFYNQM